MKTCLHLPKAGILGLWQYSSSAYFFSVLFHSAGLTVQQDKFLKCIKPEYWLNQKRKPDHLKQLHIHLVSLTKKNNVIDTESKVSSLMQIHPHPRALVIHSAVFCTSLKWLSVAGFQEGRVGYHVGISHSLSAGQEQKGKLLLLITKNSHFSHIDTELSNRN